MTEQDIREIAEKAFKARFGDIEIVCTNVRTRLDHTDDPVVDVHIVYDGKYKQMNRPDLVRISSEVIDKAWRQAEDNLGFPLVHFFAKSGIGRRDPTTI